MLSLSDSFNWIFINFPRQPNGHWYVQMFPRTSMHAGFELGTGSAINLNSNTSVASGQLFGGSVNFNANTSFKYTQVALPGTTAPGFLEDVLYKREIS